MVPPCLKPLSGRMITANYGTYLVLQADTTLMNVYPSRIILEARASASSFVAPKPRGNVKETPTLYHTQSYGTASASVPVPLLRALRQSLREIRNEA